MQGVMQIERLMIRAIQATLLGTLGLAMAACASNSKVCLSLEAGEPSTERPLELAVELGATEVAIGDRIKVTYRLRNTSGKPVVACPDGWDEFHVMNAVT